MKTNFSVIDKQFVAAQNGTLVIANFPGSPDLVGVVLELEDIDGVVFPSFHVEADDVALPIILMLAEDETTFQALGVTPGEYLATPERQELAGFFSGVCQTMGWVHNNYALVNAVYWLQKEGIDRITDDNAQKAAEVCRDAYLLLLNYCDANALDEVQVAS